MDHKTDAAEDAGPSRLPMDFRRPSPLGAVSGVPPNILLLRYEGRVYVRHRCEDTVEHLRVESIVRDASIGNWKSVGRRGRQDESPECLSAGRPLIPKVPRALLKTVLGASSRPRFIG